MYDLIRRIHLFSAAAILCFLLMYFVTGYPMIHEGLMDNPEPEKRTRVEPLHFEGEMEPGAYALYLQEKFDLRGKRTEPRRRNDGSWRFYYFRPGTWYEAIVDAEGDSVRITEGRESLRRTLIVFHRIHQYGGGWLYDLWVLFYDLASFSLIVFAATGVYMWYKLEKKKLLGGLLLGLSFAYAGAMIAYLMYAP